MIISPDFITNIAFGSVMVLIGLAGIWIVKWSTDRMIRAGQRTTVSDQESLTTLIQTTISEEISGHNCSGSLALESALPLKLSPENFDGAVASLLVMAKAESSRSLRSGSE